MILTHAGYRISLVMQNYAWLPRLEDLSVFQIADLTDFSQKYTLDLFRTC